MTDLELYKDFVKDRKRAYGARRVAKEKKIRKKHFFSKKEKVEILVDQARELGYNKDEAREYVEANITGNDHVYGSFVIMVISSIISWLIRRILDRYYDGE